MVVKELMNRNGTAAGQLIAPNGFCSDPIFAANQTGCVGPLTEKSDYTLNNVFTTIYGFDAIVASLFIATICVINEVCAAGSGSGEWRVELIERRESWMRGSRGLMLSVEVVALFELRLEGLP